MDNGLINQILSGEAICLAVGKTVNEYGDHVRSKNALSTKIDKIKRGHKARKRISTDQKIEAYMNRLDNACGDVSKVIAKNAQKAKANKFKAMRGK